MRIDYRHVCFGCSPADILLLLEADRNVAFCLLGFCPCEGHFRVEFAAHQLRDAVLDTPFPQAFLLVDSEVLKDMAHQGIMVDILLQVFL